MSMCRSTTGDKAHCSTPIQVPQEEERGYPIAATLERLTTTEVILNDFCDRTETVLLQCNTGTPSCYKPYIKDDAILGWPIKFSLEIVSI